jgi:hypothetical protein
MRWPQPRSWSELPLAILLCAGLVTGLGFTAGGLAVLVGVVASLLLLAWRYDNAVGACLPITILVDHLHGSRAANVPYGHRYRVIVRGSSPCCEIEVLLPSNLTVPMSAMGGKRTQAMS